MPYHAAIWIVDASGHRVADVAPHVDDIRGGRASKDPNQLVSRASRVVAWLTSLRDRVASWIEPLAETPGLVVRPFLAMRPGGAVVEVGVRLCSLPEDEFDRITREVPVFAGEEELVRTLDPLRERVHRQVASALEVLGALQEAVQSWRITEELTPSGDGSVVIDDTAVER